MRVVIVGGGFGGLYAAKALRDAPVEITLVDRRNYHVFQPLLYQVATAALNPADIAYPLRWVLRRQKNASVILGEARSIDLDAKIVHLADGDLAYNYLILATGATHSYFGHAEWEANAPGLKTIEDALEIRRRVLVAFENAERETDAEAQKAWLTFVIVGAGPTGVELAGALSEIARHTMTRNFRRINPSSARVILLEGKDRVLPVYPPSLSAKAAKQLEHLGVEVIANAMVTRVNDREVCIGETTIPTRTVLWAAGVQASPLGRMLADRNGSEVDRSGRVEVHPDCSLPGHPEVFVVGDLMALDGLPGLAEVAMQSGHHAARTIVRGLEGHAPERFRYRDLGTMATISRFRAVASIGRLQVGGFVGWLMWLVVHLAFLTGFKNRVSAVANWAVAFLGRGRRQRTITEQQVFARTRSLELETAGLQ
jgi:NADH dehydrogenase